MTRTAMWGMRAAALLGLLAFTACDGFDSIASPEVPLWVHHPGTSMHVGARRALTAATRKKGEDYERGRPLIDAPGMRVFIGSRDHGMYALHATDLSTLWRFETAGAVQCQPLYVPQEDALYFGSNDGAVYKLRAADGKMVWRFSSNAEVTRPPVMHGDTLFVMNANDTLIAIDAATGKLRWYQNREPAAGMEIAGYAGPTVLGQLVYAAFSDGALMAYRTKDGAEVWNGPVDLTLEAESVRGSEQFRYLDVDTTPVVGKIGHTDVLYVASYEAGVYALDALSGTRVWDNPAVVGATELTMWHGPARPKGTQLAPNHRMLIASSGLTGLWGLDPDSGAEVWRRDLPSGGITAPAAWQQALLVGTTRYGLFLIHPLDGGVLDGIHSGAAFAAAPAAYGRRAYILSNAGALLSLSISPPKPH